MSNEGKLRRAVQIEARLSQLRKQRELWNVAGDPGYAATLDLDIAGLEALAATQRNPRSQSECYWDGWNDACDAVISTSYWKRLWAEMKRPRTDPLPATQEQPAHFDGEAALAEWEGKHGGGK